MRQVREGRRADWCGRVIGARRDCMQVFVQNVCCRYEFSQIAVVGVCFVDVMVNLGACEPVIKVT